MEREKPKKWTGFVRSVGLQELTRGAAPASHRPEAAESEIASHQEEKEGLSYLEQVEGRSGP